MHPAPYRWVSPATWSLVRSRVVPSCEPGRTGGSYPVVSIVPCPRGRPLCQSVLISWVLGVSQAMLSEAPRSQSPVLRLMMGSGSVGALQSCPGCAGWGLGPWRGSLQCLSCPLLPPPVEVTLRSQLIIKSPGGPCGYAEAPCRGLAAGKTGSCRCLENGGWEGP